MWLGWTLLLGADRPPPADDASLRARLERRDARLSERTAAAEERLHSAVEDSARERAERRVVNARYRWIGVERRLDAWDQPEHDVRVLYATNRRPRDGGYGSRDGDRLHYGVATVHIPARHAAGTLDDVVVVDLQPLTQEAFLVALDGELGRAGPAAEVLAYVHGYNNSFDYAARRTAQIADDVALPVVPVLLSWPSQGGEWFAGAKYTADENAAARSSTLLADAIDELLSGAGAPVNLVAHSLGTRVVADALVDLERRHALRGGFDELVLAAPDIDAVTFGRRYLDLSLQAAERVTVYCASDDRALRLSRGIHGGYDRLGTCRPETISALERDRFDFVDASRLYVDVVDHDKVADSPRLLGDLAAVLAGTPADSPSRGLVDRGTWFELPP